MNKRKAQSNSDDTADRPNDRALAVLALGFRPFYLAAAGFAALAVPVWLLSYTGKLHVSNGLSGFAWHIHEMLFGFAPAVFAGFLLTAVRNWTGQATATVLPLAMLVLLWAAGRILLVTGPYTVAAAVDVMFLPVLGFAIALPILKSNNSRNVKLLGILGALTFLNACFHLAYLGHLSGQWLPASYTTALDVVAVLIAVMAGRVIPAFTASAVPDANPQRHQGLEVIALGTLIALAIVDLVAPWWTVSGSALVVLLASACIAHAFRLAFWVPLRTRGDALLLMLPLAYAWLPVYLGLRAAASVGIGPPAAATHALTIGAMGGLMVAMMMRSALGHTGRALRAGKSEITIFLLILFAALTRVSITVLIPAWQVHAAVVSGILWALGFGMLFIVYWPRLTRPRVDGKPG
jgi:uncharacterized protein involved in response to NO